VLRVLDQTATTRTAGQARAEVAKVIDDALAGWLAGDGAAARARFDELAALLKQTETDLHADDLFAVSCARDADEQEVEPGVAVEEVQRLRQLAADYRERVAANNRRRLAVRKELAQAAEEARAGARQAMGTAAAALVATHHQCGEQAWEDLVAGLQEPFRRWAGEQPWYGDVYAVEDLDARVAALGLDVPPDPEARPQPKHQPLTGSGIAESRPRQTGDRLA
jgi:hypothetical protein